MARQLKLIFVGTLVAFSARAFDTICYDSNNGFVTDAPTGWVADFTRAKELDLCVIYYLKGTDFHSSPAVIYPRLVSTPDSGDVAIRRLVREATDRYKVSAQNLQVNAQPKFKNKHGLRFQFRHFLNGPAPNEFESVAYHAGRKAIFLSVFSARTKSAFDAHSAKLKEFVGLIRAIPVKNLPKGLPPPNL